MSTNTATSAKDLFTVGQAAKYLRCSPDKVRGYYDAQKLKGDREGSQGNRRISRESLVALMTELQIDLGDLAPQAPVGDEANPEASAPAADGGQASGETDSTSNDAGDGANGGPAEDGNGQ